MTQRLDTTKTYAAKAEVGTILHAGELGVEIGPKPGLRLQGHLPVQAQ